MKPRKAFTLIMSGLMLAVSCTKDKKEDTTPPPAPPLATDSTGARLVSAWRLIHVTYSEYVDGVQVASDIHNYSNDYDSVWFHKGDSCTAKVGGTFYKGQYKISKNILYTTPDSFRHIHLDSAQYRFDTYMLWADRFIRSYTDAEGKERKVYAHHLFVQ